MGRLFLDLYTYMSWADARMWRALSNLPASSKDKNFIGLIAHLHTTQRAFLQVWKDEPFEFVSPDSFSTLEEVFDFASPFYSSAIDFIGSLKDEDLQSPMVLPWAKFFGRQLGHDPADTTLGETILQLSHHTSHHRGQANMQIRMKGGTPLLLDYIGWLWSERPEADWNNLLD